MYRAWYYRNRRELTTDDSAKLAESLKQYTTEKSQSELDFLARIEAKETQDIIEGKQVEAE